MSNLRFLCRKTFHQIIFLYVDFNGDEVCFYAKILQLEDRLIFSVIITGENVYFLSDVFLGVVVVIAEAIVFVTKTAVLVATAVLATSRVQLKQVYMF